MQPMALVQQVPLLKLTLSRINSLYSGSFSLACSSASHSASSAALGSSR